MHAYLDSMRAMYQNSLLQNGEIYDIAMKLTSGFSSISPEAILQDSRIIKILRYSIAPSISQMKFGQFFGISSIDRFENDKLTSGTEKYRQLKRIAEDIAAFAQANLDYQRFLWLPPGKEQLCDQRLAERYAKNWTCSIAADQNAQTRYRNWRKDQQADISHLPLAQLRRRACRATI